MKILKIILGVLGAIVVLAVTIGFILPSKHRVERSLVINAPPSAIYPLIANLKTGWPQWPPFGPSEYPGLKVTYAGPDEGVGASQSWDSKKTGDGTLTIIKADRMRGIEYDMVTMHDSFRLTGALICEPAASGTKVTWRDDMDVGNNLLHRYMGWMVEKPLGKSFEKGLASLKKKAEASAAATATK